MNPHVIDAIVNFAATTFGVLLGLLLSGWVSSISDKAVYKAIQNSLYAEANANLKALKESFEVYELVLNEFRIEVALNSLANPLFLRKAKSGHIENLNGYVRHLSLANNYALMARQVASPSNVKKPEDLGENWKRNLGDCQKSIDRILRSYGRPS